VMGLPASWVGLASVLALLWNAAIDPYVGYLSDQARFRFGRRHTFMLVGALTMGVTFWAFLSPPRGLSPPLLLLWLLVTSLLVRRPYLSTSDARDVPQRPRGFSIAILQCLRNPSFLVLFTSCSLFFLGVVINSSLSLYYLTYYARITASAAVSGFQLSFYVGG